MGKDSGFRERLPEADHLAFQALFERFYRPLLGFFLKRGCTEAESEDLVQEALLNAYRGFDRFRHEASNTTWIFTIAGNLWLNHLRSRRTHKRGPGTVSLEQVDETGLPQDGSYETRLSALDQILEDERKDLLRTAIRELPEGRRHALHLRIVHGLKYREIADLLEIEINTVKSQIFQAKKQLEEKLSPHLQKMPAGKESP